MSRVATAPAGATLPVELASHLADVDVLAVTEPLAFPFEALPSPRRFGLAVSFDDTDTTAEVMAQYHEVLFSKLGNHDVLAGPAALLDAVAERTWLDRDRMLNRDAADFAAAWDNAVAGIDGAAAGADRTLRAAAGRMLVDALAELPAEITPRCLASGPASERLAGDVADEGMWVGEADQGAAHIGVVSRLGDRSVAVADTWTALAPGGSMVIGQDLQAQGDYPALVAEIADVSLRHAVLAGVETIRCPDPVVIVRVRKLGRSQQL